MFFHENDNRTDSNNSTLTDDNKCYYEKGLYLVERFFLITICGTIVACIGLINNVLLVYIFTRPKMIVGQLFYFAVLAAFDILICVSYIMLFPIQNLFDYLEDIHLYEAWNFYLKPIFALSHVSMTVSTYMIVAASAERYLTTSFILKRNCLPKHRSLVVFCIFCFCVISKGVVYWELDVVRHPNCTGFAYFSVEPSELARYLPYRRGYVLWFRHLVHVFLPFICLVVLNSAIIKKLKQTAKPKLLEEAVTLQRSNLAEEGRGSGYAVDERKKNIRRATQMLVVIVSTYLVSNVLNVVVTAFENFYPSFLRHNEDFYSFATDVVSLLTILTSALRLPTYYVFNKQVRKEIHFVFQRLFTRSYKSEFETETELVEVK